LAATHKIFDGDSVARLSSQNPAFILDIRTPATEGLPTQRIWLWIIASVIGLMLGAFAYLELWMTKPPIVAVEIIQDAPVTRILALNGRLAAFDSVDIQPVVTGTLIAITVSEGEVVTAGQILAQLDAAAQSAIVRQAVAGVEAALVTQAQANENYERALSLSSNITRSVLETKAHLAQTAAQEVARQTAALDHAQVALDNHTIRAPRNGTIVVLHASLGQLSGPTVPLLTLADLDGLIVEANVDEAYATQIEVGQPAVLRLTGEAKKLHGHISFVSSVVNEATGGLAVQIDFDAPIIAPIGLTVSTNIIVEQSDAALTLPRTALQSGADGTGVIVVRHGIAMFQPVSVINWPAARLIVTAGLIEGDAVIIDPTGIDVGQTVLLAQP
jgi:RND family efflux transporter MFP subunit